MDLHLIVDGLDETKRTDNKLPKIPTPTRSPIKPLRLHTDEFRSVETAICVPSSPPDHTHLKDMVTLANLKNTFTPENLNMQGDIQVPEYSSLLPDRYCHPKHFNPPLIVPSNKKKGNATKIPVKVISNTQEVPHQQKCGFPSESIPVSNHDRYPGNELCENSTCTSNFMSYPSPQRSPHLAHGQINQVVYPGHPGYHVIDTLPMPPAPVPSPPYTMFATPYSSVAIPHTTQAYQQPPVSGIPCAGIQIPGSAYADVTNDPLQQENPTQHNNEQILPEAPNSSPKSLKFVDQLKQNVNKPTVSASLVNEHIMLIDADTNTVLPDKRKSTNKNIKYGCKQCSRVFLRKCDLVRHIQMHLGIRPNICGVCGKRFIQRSALTIHLRVHTGEKPFGCSLCGRAFSDSSSLARHRYTHQRNAKKFADRMRDLQYRTSIPKYSTN